MSNSKCMLISSFLLLRNFNLHLLLGLFNIHLLLLMLRLLQSFSLLYSCLLYKLTNSNYINLHIYIYIFIVLMNTYNHNLVTNLINSMFVSML